MSRFLAGRRVFAVLALAGVMALAAYVVAVARAAAVTGGGFYSEYVCVGDGGDVDD